MNGAPKHIANCYQKLQREAWNKISLLSFQRNQYCLHLDFHSSHNQEVYFPLFETNKLVALRYSCPNKATRLYQDISQRSCSPWSVTGDSLQRANTERSTDLEGRL